MIATTRKGKKNRGETTRVKEWHHRGLGGPRVSREVVLARVLLRVGVRVPRVRGDGVDLPEVSVSRGSEMLAVLMHRSVGGATVDIMASAGRALVDVLHVDSRVIAQRIARRVSRDLHYLRYHHRFLSSRSHLLVDMVSRVVVVLIIIRVTLPLILPHRIHILRIRTIQAVLRVATLRILEGILRILLILPADSSGIREFSHSRERLLLAVQDHLDSLILRDPVVVCLDDLVSRTEVAVVDSSRRAVFITSQRMTSRITRI